jgi:hypothetical protein
MRYHYLIQLPYHFSAMSSYILEDIFYGSPKWLLSSINLQFLKSSVTSDSDEAVTPSATRNFIQMRGRASEYSYRMLYTLQSSAAPERLINRVGWFTKFSLNQFHLFPEFVLALRKPAARKHL